MPNFQQHVDESSTHRNRLAAIRKERRARQCVNVSHVLSVPGGEFVLGHNHHLYASAFYPISAYFMAVAGSSLGIACAARFYARKLSEGWPWLISGALTLGSGIWGMHFIAMLGFTIDDVELRYDVPLTIFSLVVAVVIVGLGILVAHTFQSVLGVLTGGVGTGLGVAAMHYMGMAALIFPGELGYDAWLVAVSLVIAISAATTALWFTLRVRGSWTTLSAALVMAVAISGMHYTGMTAVSVRSVAGVVSGDGVSGLSLVAPLIIGLGIEVMMVTFGVLMNPIKETSRSGKVLPGRSRRDDRRAPAPVSQVLSSETYHVSGPHGRSHGESGGAQGDHHMERRHF